MTWEPEEFDDLAAELRRRVAAEFRSEAEEVELLVQLQRRRKATLRDVATTAMHQGHGVTVLCFGNMWSGELLAVGSDYLSLLTASNFLEARLDSITMGLTPVRQGGRTGRPASETFRARLTEFELTGEELTLRCISPLFEATGVIEVVASDHVEMRIATDRCFLPLDGVVMAIRSRPE
jgi:hypothetical protein